MDAQQVAEIPLTPGWQYEPKWDGFRCLVFRDGKHVELQSKSGQPLARYFPELVAAVLELSARRFVLDSEIVVPSDDGKTLLFEALLQRIHPSESRIQKLAKQTPGVLIVFDLLVDSDGKSLVSMTLNERRKKLNTFAKEHLRQNRSMLLSPATTDPDVAKSWWKMVGNELDGIIAKRRDMPYMTDERTGMVKVKKLRTADCVVGGFRYASKSKVIGSLLLGLYDDAGLLHHVGFTSGLSAAQRKELTPKLEALISPPGFTGSAPGGPSRWSTERSTEWQPLKSKLVVEVQFDHFTGGRFRHGTRLLRWRPDKAPRQCTLKQVEHDSELSLQTLAAL